MKFSRIACLCDGTTAGVCSRAGVPGNSDDTDSMTWSQRRLALRHLWGAADGQAYSELDLFDKKKVVAI